MNKLKKLADIGASLVLAVSFAFPLIVHVATAHAFSGVGEGTSDFPYRITDCNQLQEMNDDLSADYVLTASFSCSDTTSWNSGAGFIPIGNSAAFTGSLDGRGNTVSDLFVNASILVDDAGLFDTIDGGTVRNLSLDNESVTGGGFVGGLAAISDNATLSDVNITNETISGELLVGGLIASDQYTTINRAYTTGTVTNTGQYTGGLLGSIGGGSVNDSFSSADVDGADDTGGLIGNLISGSIVARTYSSGSVSGANQVGGLIGSVDGTGGSLGITDSFTVSPVTASDINNIGGFTGVLESVSAGELNNNFFDRNLTGQNFCDTIHNATYSSVCTGIDADGSDSAHFKNNDSAAPFNNWDFSGIWAQNSGYPSLIAPSLFETLNDVNAPDTPTNLQSDPQDSALGMEWDAPGSDGGSPVTNYSVEYRVHGTSTWTVGNTGSTNTNITIGGSFTNGDVYDIGVAAINAQGTSSYDEVDSIIIGPLPTAPLNLQITPDVPDGQAALTWDAPSDAGGSPITQYNVYWRDSTDFGWTHSTNTGNTDTNYTVTGLTAGHNYDFKVTASSLIGEGPGAEQDSVAFGDQVYNITDCQELQDIQNDPAGDYTLGSEIDCTDFDFTPITDFTGTLDGGGHNITNLIIDLPGDDGIGLFSDIEGGTVHDLNLSSSDAVNGANEVGMLAGYVGGNANIYNVGSQAAVNGDNHVGGLIGKADGTTGDIDLNNLSFSGSVDPLSGDSSTSLGGLVGSVEVEDHTFTLQNSSFSGSAEATIDSESTGGLIGSLSAYDDANVQIHDDDTTDSAVSGGDRTGGVIGFIHAAFLDEFDTSPTINLYNLSHNSGNSISGQGGVGGVIGDLEAYDGSVVSLATSYNTSEIDSSDGGAGGVVGYIDTDPSGKNVSITTSYSTGDVNSDSDAVGGFVGEIDDPIIISNSYSHGEVMGANYVGGFAGYIGGSDFTDVYASGAVQGNGDSIGGLIGAYDNGTISDSFAAGQVSDLAESSDIGGLIGSGLNVFGATVNNSYYDRTVSNQENCIGDSTGINVNFCGQPDGEGSDPSYFLDNDSSPPLDQWNFDDTWQTVDNDYPQLQFQDGGGSPTAITDCDELQNMGDSGDYVLANDIDCSDTINWNEGAGFIPIGFGSGFSGTLDGQGHKITGLYINQPDTPLVGLFSTIGGTTISNLSLSGQVTGGIGTGGLVGLDLASQISNVSVNMNVTAQATSDQDGEEEIVGVGGLVGMMAEDSTVSQSYSSGNVIDSSGDTTFIAGGGLVGEMFDGLVTDSYSTASVTDSGSDGDLINGGLVGIMFDGGEDAPTVTNTYSTGAVNVGDGQLAAGLVGGMMGGIVNNSFSASPLSAGEEGAVGGLIGQNGADELNNNFFDAARTGTSDCDENGGDFPDCLAINTGDSPDSDYFFNNTSNDPFSGQWDFDDIWSTTDTYPILQNTPTVSSTIEITDCAGLQNINNDLSADYVLMNDIDCSDSVNWNDGAGFIPIAFDSMGGFTGSLDGQGHSISDIYINQLGSPRVGLFAVIDNGQVSDLSLTGQVFGDIGTGGLAGIASNAQIRNVSDNVTVTAISLDSDNEGDVLGVGGLIGYMENGSSIDQSYSSGAVKVSAPDGDTLIAGGGLVGQMEGGSLENSYSTASVTDQGSQGQVANGGLVGFIEDTEENTPFIYNTYATGAVSAGPAQVAGGLVGAANGGEIQNSFAAGALSGGDESELGGLIGQDSTDSLLNDNYDANLTQAPSCTSAGDPSGCQAKDTNDNPDPTYYFNNTVNSPFGEQWDFDNIWDVHANTYPTLQSVPEATPTINITDCDELQDMADNLSADYVLMNNIDCSDTANWNGGDGFIPVGGNNGFRGTLDGQGYAITGLHIIGGDDDTGLFNDLVDSGEVKDLYLTGDISGNATVGAVVGATDGNSTVVNVNSNASVSGIEDSSNLGGLVGYMGGHSSVNQSTSSGSVSTNNVNNPNMGGLVGQLNEFATLTNSYSRANLSLTGDSMSGQVGGIVGYISGFGSINKSYAVTTIHATGAVGGIAGETDENGAISNTFAAYSFSLDDLSAVGAVVGVNEGNGTFSNNYYDNALMLASFGSSVDCLGTGFGVDPLDCVEVNADGSDPAHFFDSSSVEPLNTWDFDTVWAYRTDDYPVLQSPTEGQMTVFSTPHDNELDVSWTPPTGPLAPTSYDLQYRLDGDSDWTTVPVTGLNISKDITGLQPGTNYDVRVRYTNQFETGGWLTFEQFTTGTDNSGGGDSGNSGNNNNDSGSGGLTVTTLTTGSGDSGGSSTPADSSSDILLNDFGDYLDGQGHEITGLKVGQVIHFNIDNNGSTEHHTATVKSIDGDVVTFTIHSTSFDVQVAVGQTKTVALYGRDVLKITVNAITNGLVDATFTQINPAAASTNSKAAAGFNTKPPAAKKTPGQSHRQLYEGIAIGIPIGIFLSWIFFLLLTRRRDKDDEQNKKTAARRK